MNYHDAILAKNLHAEHIPVTKLDEWFRSNPDKDILEIIPISGDSDYIKCKDVLVIWKT